MSYDEALAGRVRTAIGDEPGIREQAMFGGLAFLLHGNMSVAASGQGGLLVRVDPKDGQELVDGTSIVPMEMGGRTMTGWLHVHSDAVRTDAELQAWVDRGLGHARTLPPKKPK